MKKLFLYALLFLVGLSVSFWYELVVNGVSINSYKPRNSDMGGFKVEKVQSIVSKQKCTSIDGLPDPKCNEPIENKNLTLAQVCSPTFKTNSIRPSTSYTNKLKIQGMIDYGYPLNSSLVEEDHLGAITDKFDPKDPKNLWPQFWDLNVNGFNAGAHTKDKLEVKIHKLLCNKTISFNEAQVCFSDWISCYRKYIGELPKFTSTTKQ